MGTLLHTQHTLFIILRDRLIMLSPQLRPFRKLILRAGGGHLLLQPQDIRAERVGFLHRVARRGGEFVVERP